MAVLLILVLIAAVVALLYFGGVFERLGNRRAEPAPVERTGPAAPSAPGDLTALAPDASPQAEICTDVYTEQQARDLPPDDRVRNTVTVSASGDYLWNGATVDSVRLRQYLDIVGTMSPTPMTVVSVAPGAPPVAVEALSVLIYRALDCRFQPS